MNFIDHSKGHTPAKRGDHVRWSVTLYHNRCGKRVIGSLFMAYSCDGPCRESWKSAVMAGFDDAAMATRFHVRAEPDRAEYVIVWVTDEYSKARHTKTVPISEAGNLERFKL